MVGAQDCHALMADLSRGGRLRYRWLTKEDMPRTEVKLAYLLLLCLETAMPYGGEIEVSQEDGRWLLRGTADRMKIDGNLWALIVDPTANIDVTAAEVHFALVAPAATRAGCRIASELNETEIVIRF